MSSAPPDILFSPEASFELILKIKEDCNINCKYCYMYNLGNDAYKLVQEKTMTRDTFSDVGKFIRQEFETRSPKSARIILHGGEPMMMKTQQLDARLQALWTHLVDLPQSTLDKISISVQTNATLVSDEWLKTIKKWRMSVGVTIDGPEDVHDRQRLDKKGRGTYRRVEAGLKRMLDAGSLRPTRIGALCVIDPNSDGRLVYRHFSKDLGLRSFNFLLPFMNWDTFDESVLAGVSAFLVDAFDEWAADIQNGIFRDVRIFRDLLSSIRDSGIGRINNTVTVGNVFFVVESDGSIMPDESLRSTYTGFFSEMNISSSTLRRVFYQRDFYKTFQDLVYEPEECMACALLSSCRGGAALGQVGMRFDSASDRLSKSVYCKAFVELYVTALAFLKAMGDSALPDGILDCKLNQQTEGERLS